MQVVPLPLDDGLPPSIPIEPALRSAADSAQAGPLQPFKAHTLPWQCYAAALPPNPTDTQLETAFISLLSYCSSSALTHSHTVAAAPLTHHTEATAQAKQQLAVPSTQQGPQGAAQPQGPTVVQCSVDQGVVGGCAAITGV